MNKVKHPSSRKERMELEIKKREGIKYKSVSRRIKEEIRDEETKDELKEYT